MVRYEWRVSLLDGMQDVRLSGQGIWIGDKIWPWAELSGVGFVRYQTRSGMSEEFTLSFGPEIQHKLRWIGIANSRAPWREVLVAFANHAARARPDLQVRDGPDAQDAKTARWIGLGVSAVSVAIAAAVIVSGPSIWGALAAGWIGLVGGTIGLLIYGHYARQDDPPRLDWAAFAKREGQPGELPAN